MLNTVKDWTIDDIRSLDEKSAFVIAEDRTVIKEHTIYFVDFGGYFGYSALAFADGHHIIYADDYELHHENMERADLRAFYERSMNNKLFTEAEISEPLKTYDEYRAKLRYLQSYYPLRRGHLSMFRIIHNKDEEAAYEQEKENYPITNPVAFAYYLAEDEQFVKRNVELVGALEQQYKNTRDNYEYQKSAFYYEMGNHEYHINHYQADYDTLSAFGHIEWHGDGAAAREKYFDELDFTDLQRRAYMDARRDFLRDADEKGWY